jgi:hypothetical protein
MRHKRMRRTSLMGCLQARRPPFAPLHSGTCGGAVGPWGRVAVWPCGRLCGAAHRTPLPHPTPLPAPHVTTLPVGCVSAQGGLGGEVGGEGRCGRGGKRIDCDVSLSFGGAVQCVESNVTPPRGQGCTGTAARALPTASGRGVGWGGGGGLWYMLCGSRLRVGLCGTGLGAAALLLLCCISALPVARNCTGGWRNRVTGQVGQASRLTGRVAVPCGS